jgi:hypothetical protein
VTGDFFGNNLSIGIKYLPLPYGLGHPLIVSATKVQRIDEICKQMYLKCTQTKNFEIFSFLVVSEKPFIFATS